MPALGMNTTGMETSPVSIFPPAGRSCRKYDAANRLIAETHREERSGIDNRTQFGYDAAGNLTEITDNQGRKTRIARPAQPGDPAHRAGRWRAAHGL